MKNLLSKVKEGISKIPKEKIIKELISVIGILFLISYVTASRRGTEPTGTWAIGTERHEREYVYECDATAENLYFSYLVGNKMIIDVYSNDGQFLYLISVVDNYTSGGNDMRCYDGKLYIQMKNNAVYVFQGKELVQTLSSKEAWELGLTEHWFEKRNITLTMDDMYIYRVDGEGTTISRTPRDPEIRVRPHLIDFGESGNQVAGIVISAAFIIIIVTLNIVGISSTKKKPPRLGRY